MVGKRLKMVTFCVGLVLAVACAPAQEAAGTIVGEMYPIPPETHSDSGYTAIECGLDGRVYVGTANYGASAHLVAFDPETKQWEDLIDAHKVTRHTGTGLDSHSKFHAKIVVGADGRVWAATKQGNEEFSNRPEYGENPTGYPGGHLFSYDPKTGRVVDHGVLKKQEGLMGGSIDNERGRIYYWSDPKQHLLMFDIASNTVRDLGTMGSYPRYTVIDPKGRVFGMMWPDNVVGMEHGVWMYDPEADKVHFLAVKPEGEGQYQAPYVIVLSADGKTIFGCAFDGGEYVMEFDLDSINLEPDGPGFDGTITCRNVCRSIPEPFKPGDQHGGVLGKDGCFYYTNNVKTNESAHLIRYDPRKKAIEDLGLIAVKGQPDLIRPYMQGACVAPDGTLYLKFIYKPYCIMKFDKLTSPDRSK